MHASFRVKASELTDELLQKIKALFQGEEIDIEVYPSAPDDTTLIMNNPTYYKKLIASIEQSKDPNKVIQFTPEELETFVKKQLDK